MADETQSTALTLDHQPPSEALAASFDRLKMGVPSGKQGAAHAAVTTQGVEAGVAWQPRTDLWLTGYAGRMWGSSSWEAGAKLAYTW